ncbi:hypothetical protein [Pararhizobium sp. DWP3-4]|uniref:hypothetical protein n=1 Tax=Pararhizobium sp. DWP3-4 TaxID=2804565 RepID=UPI003CFB25DB
MAVEISQEIADRLVNAPSEALNVEIKRWIDPTDVLGISKIAIACMALRNRNGGYLVIGLDDTSLEPTTDGMPTDVKAAFHIDVIQSIVSKYSSVAFEVAVAFGKREEMAFPVIAVAGGVTAPVAASKELSVAGKSLIRQHAVYFRTLNASGVPSSSPARYSDWADIVEICFDNREADIGRFLRRHLGTTAGALFGTPAEPPDVRLRKRAEQVLREGDERRKDAFLVDEYTAKAAALGKFGAWSVGLAVDPPFPPTDSSLEFLRTLAAANPRYTGWPVWLDSSGAAPESQPRKRDKAWETVLLSDESSSWSRHADFYRVHAKGEFYLWRALQDDLTDKVEPLKVFDPGLMIYRVAETIAVGLVFARALGANEHSSLGFEFKWEGMKGRTLESWADRRYFSPWGAAYDDIASGFVAVPFDTPVSAIAPYVKQATTEVCGLFNGFEYPVSAIEQAVEKLLKRG